jgi:membrane-associated phospholipid phosphatase
VIAWIKHYRRYALISTVFALSIPFATLYLGIHWLTDIIFGELFALGALIVGYYLSKRIMIKNKRVISPLKKKV